MPHSKQVYEIRIQDLIWNLLSQWKAVLIVAILIAIIITGMKYTRDINAYNEAIDSQRQAEEMSNIPVDEQIAKVLEPFSEEDVTKVEYLIAQREWVEKEKDYYNNSILLNVDPTSQRTLILDYYIEAEEKTNTIAATLGYSYSAYITNEKIVEKLRQIINPDIDKKYISELINTPVNYNGGSGYISSIDDGDLVLEIKIVLPEYVDAKAIESTITTSLEEYSSELQKIIGTHSISLIRSDEANLYNSNAVNNKNGIIASISNIETIYLKNAESTLSDEQKAAADAIISIKKNAQKAENIANGTAEIEIKKDEMPVKPNISKKYAVLGLILGFLMYALLLLLYIVFRARIISANQLEQYTSNRLLGEIYFSNDYKGLSKLLHSKKINGIRYKDKLDVDKQIEKAVTSIDAACKYSEADKINLLLLSVNNEEREIQKLLDEIHNKGIETEVVNIDETIESKLIHMDNTLIITGNNSKVADLCNLSSLIGTYHLPQLGDLYLGRV